MKPIESPPTEHAHEGFLSADDGFLPSSPPLKQLSPAFAAWDQLAQELPAHARDLSLQQAMEALPQLDASSLPEAELCRAASLLGIFVHTLTREKLMRQPDLEPATEQGQNLPPQLLLPWQQICQRLGRPGAGMTYSDLILYNWRLKDPTGPRVVENMELLTPVYATAEERMFYLVMVETHSSATPLVRLVQQMETAQTDNAPEQMQQALQGLAEMLNEMSYTSFLKIDPNPYSPVPVDHLVWAKTVAPFAFPVMEGELGLSGGGSPVFHALDALFGRRSYASQIGQELLELQKWMPGHLQEFLARCSRLNLAKWCEEQGHPALPGEYANARQSYCGERGWLGLHRLKVYGFMEVGFKAGRTQTNGGFQGEVEKRAWEALDDSIEESRQERLDAQAPASRCPFAKHWGTRQVAQEGIYNVKLNTQNQGLHFRPGDRVGLQPRNAQILIDKTLEQLQATGEEPVRLTGAWQAALVELGEPLSKELPLRVFLRHAKLRPLLRPSGKALLKLMRVPKLQEMLDKRQEDQLELWEALALMRTENYDTRRLWQAGPWQRENLARILPPERMRIYSISSAPSEDQRNATVELTVGALKYATPAAHDQTPTAREGTASHFVTRPQFEALGAQIVRPSRFCLPHDTARPIFMFGGGTGISPFRGFWQARRGAGPNWLFVGARSPKSLAYQEELRDEVQDHALNLQIAFSRDPQVIRGQGGRWHSEDGEQAYIDQRMREQAQVLWEALRPLSEGGSEGYFYICGQTRFAHTVMECLKSIISENLHQPVDSEAVKTAFRQLVAQQRLMLDIFTTFAPADAPGVQPYQLYDASELVEHNSPEAGYWTVIQGQVYDLSEFMWLHPGGARILLANAGLDCTRSYEKVNHHLNAEVHAMLDLYKIGKVRRLNFGEDWAATLMPPELCEDKALKTSMVYFTLQDLYRHWIQYLYTLVEQENTLANNQALRELRLSDQSVGDLPAIKRALLTDVHRIFISGSLQQLTGPLLQQLWHMTLGMCAPEQNLAALKDKIQLIWEELQPLAETSQAHLLSSLECDPAAADTMFKQILELNAGELRRLKGRLRKGIQLFEQHEDKVIAEAGEELTAILNEIPAWLKGYTQALKNHLAHSYA